MTQSHDQCMTRVHRICCKTTNEVPIMSGRFLGGEVPRRFEFVFGRKGLYPSATHVGSRRAAFFSRHSCFACRSPISRVNAPLHPAITVRRAILKSTSARRSANVCLLSRPCRKERIACGSSTLSSSLATVPVPVTTGVTATLSSCSAANVSESFVW